MAYHVHRLARLGPPMLISGNWYEAHIRVRAGSRAYSITGITHTISSTSVMKMIADMAIAPIMPWDGLICTSRAVQSAVSKIFSAQEDYLRWKFKASEPFARPEMPVIPLGVHCSDFAEVNASNEDHRQKLGIDSDTIVFLFLGRLSFHAKAHPFPMCAIPDDHIDPRRSAFFMARSILRDIRSGVRAC